MLSLEMIYMIVGITMVAVSDDEADNLTTELSAISLMDTDSQPFSQLVEYADAAEM